jgi:hypothetical protein
VLHFLLLRVRRVENKKLSLGYFSKARKDHKLTNMENWQIALALVIVAVVIVAIVCWNKMKSKEGYSNIGAVDNIGSLDDSYDLVKSEEEYVPGEHFADLVDAGDQEQIIKSRAKMNKESPMTRLDRLQGKGLMPRVSKDVTPYNIDVADPVTYSYMVNTPRVSLKDPQFVNAGSGVYYRGDIPIRYFPNIALVGRSRYGRDSLFLQGTFSPHMAALYDKYSGKAYKNMPIKVSNEETLMDY